MSARPRLVAIVGPTAVGKTALAIELSQRFGGEIINADSRQVYLGMDIGTAKPTADEQAAARHHLIDIRRPDAPLSMGEFIPMATTAIADVSSRGCLPILCGGTGQYVWALLEAWHVPEIPPDAAFRASLEGRAACEGGNGLWRELLAVDPARAAKIDPRNTRRVIRALEICYQTGSPVVADGRAARPPYDALIIGLSAERSRLYERIDHRVDRMMDAGLLDEAQRLASLGYTLGQGPLSGVGYSQLCQHLAGELCLDQAVKQIKTRTHRLVRRQNTWFKSTDPRITWLDATAALPVACAEAKVRQFLEAIDPCGTIAPV